MRFTCSFQIDFFIFNDICLHTLQESYSPTNYRSKKKCNINHFISIYNISYYNRVINYIFVLYAFNVFIFYYQIFRYVFIFSSINFNIFSLKFLFIIVLIHISTQIRFKRRLH